MIGFYDVLIMLFMDSKCLSCVNYCGEPKYVAVTSGGIRVVSTGRVFFCLEHGVDLPLISSDGCLVPDIIECLSYDDGGMV